MKLDLATLLLQRRFRAPDHWDWSYRSFHDGTKIRYGQVRARKPYQAVAVIIGGLRDFGEQYYELANELEDKHIKSIIIDLPGQGGSSRYLPDEPMKRHSNGFDVVLSQLHSIMDEIVLSAAIDSEDNHKRLPCVLIGHSMGAHLSLRYLSEYNRSSRGSTIFKAATLSAPMIGIQAVNQFPPLLRHVILKILSLFPKSFVPGGCAWYDGYRERFAFKGIFSTDPERYELQRAYFSDPDHQFLVIGSPTNKWLLDAYYSCQKMEKKDYLEKIEIPVLIGLAGSDKLIENTSILEAAKRLKQSELMEIPNCHHEIFMESDKFRKPFVERFFTFIEENVLNKTDKGKTYIQ
ncbi:MAG: alpha/beta hydrolase [Alphaproteobacteria bacterium]|nr:alpha/beta hydrolase [Alphaproteobacteria bacterium]